MSQLYSTKFLIIFLIYLIEFHVFIFNNNNILLMNLQVIVNKVLKLTIIINKVII